MPSRSRPYAADAAPRRRVVRRIGEEHVAVGGDREVVRAQEAVVGEVGDGAVGARELQARESRAGRGRVGEQPERGEVDAAVLGDEDRTVGRERGTVRAAAGVGEHASPGSDRLHAEQRAFGDARDDQRAVAAPHRPLTEPDPVAHNFGVHEGKVRLSRAVRRLLVARHARSQGSRKGPASDYEAV